MQLCSGLWEQLPGRGESSQVAMRNTESVSSRYFQEVESALLDEFNEVWLRLGLISHPVRVDITLPQRSPGLYLFLTVVTLRMVSVPGRV